MSDDALQRLVNELEGAQSTAAQVVGETVLGVRAVEPAPGRRAYLCAFAGPRFLCLDHAMVVVGDAGAVRSIAACALLVEHAEGLIDAGEFDVLASACVSLAGAVEAQELMQVLSGLEHTSRQISAWCSEPERAVASLHAIDQVVTLHDAARRLYERFIESTEPLVEMQDRLSDELVAALREVEEGAARCGLPQPLANAIAQGMEALDAGAQEMLDVHAVPVVAEG